MASPSRSRGISIAVAMVAMAVTVVGTGSGASFAVSDGHYSYRLNDCTGSADNANSPTSTQSQCKSLIFTVFDGNGHEYFGAGIPQTADGTPANAIDFWADPGLGQDLSWTLSESGGISNVVVAPSTQPAADPTSGLTLYFGADDNLDVGEHDSSGYVNNGPSDGGGVVVNVSPATAGAWVSALRGCRPAGTADRAGAAQRRLRRLRRRVLHLRERDPIGRLPRVEHAHPPRRRGLRLVRRLTAGVAAVSLLRPHRWLRRVQRVRRAGPAQAARRRQPLLQPPPIHDARLLQPDRRHRLRRTRHPDLRRPRPPSLARHHRHGVLGERHPAAGLRTTRPLPLAIGVRGHLRSRRLAAAPAASPPI